MGIEPRVINPEAIENESFRIIHATADFDFAKNVIFHPEAVKNAIEAIKRGENVIVDVEMIKGGINKSGLSKFGGQVLSFMAD